MNLKAAIRGSRKTRKSTESGDSKRPSNIFLSVPSVYSVDLIRRRAFVLLEAMLAVAIFAIGVLALGAAVNNCLVAERFKEEDSRARRALGNRIAEIEAESVKLTDSSTEELKGFFEGMTLKTTRVPVKKKNEKEQDILGIYSVRLEVMWKSDGADQAREITFYFYPKQI